MPRLQNLHGVIEDRAEVGLRLRRAILFQPRIAERRDEPLEQRPLRERVIGADVSLVVIRQRRAVSGIDAILARSIDRVAVSPGAPSVAKSTVPRTAQAFSPAVLKTICWRLRYEGLSPYGLCVVKPVPVCV